MVSNKRSTENVNLVHLISAYGNAFIEIDDVTASSGTAISTDFATLTCSEILSKILIRCVTWHWACDCSFRCFHEIGRFFDNKEQERAKTRARRHDNITIHMPQRTSKILLVRLTANRNALLFLIRVTSFARYTGCSLSPFCCESPPKDVPKI